MAPSTASRARAAQLVPLEAQAATHSKREPMAKMVRAAPTSTTSGEAAEAVMATIGQTAAAADTGHLAVVEAVQPMEPARQMQGRLSMSTILQPQEPMRPHLRRRASTWEALAATEVAVEAARLSSTQTEESTSTTTAQAVMALSEDRVQEASSSFMFRRSEWLTM